MFYVKSFETNNSIKNLKIDTMMCNGETLIYPQLVTSTKQDHRLKQYGNDNRHNTPV